MVRQDVFDVISASLFADRDIGPFDMDAVFAEMKIQGVGALPGKWLMRHRPSEAAEWIQYCALQQGIWIRMMHLQAQVLALLEDRGIPCVIIKGTAAAMAYPHPALRPMGDIDLLVKSSDVDAAAAILEARGYALKGKKDPKAHHYQYVRDGVMFELHWRMSAMIDADEHWQSLLEYGVDHRVTGTAEGYRFPVLPPVLNGLVLILHIDHHLRKGIGLRQIVDWMMYIDGLPADVWNDELRPLLREAGMERFALTVTAMCQKYLGLRTIVDAVDGYPCDALMDHIMDSGNFGQKNGFGDRITQFMFRGKNGIFRRLQKGGLKRWKAAAKYRALRPFAWLYQCFWLIGELVRHRVKPGALIEHRKKGMEKRELIDALGLRIKKGIQ